MSSWQLPTRLEVGEKHIRFIRITAIFWIFCIG